MTRQHDLERQIRESYDLIQEYEDRLTYSSDPKEQARFRCEIAEQWALIEERWQARQALGGPDLPAGVGEIVARFAGLLAWRTWPATCGNGRRRRMV